jgi:hypothetical protein
MAYYATQALEPITKGHAKKVHPTSGLGCSACAAMGATPIVAVSGLGDSASLTNLLKYAALFAIAGGGVMYLGARATESSTGAFSARDARAKKFVKYGALFGAAVGGLYFGGPAQQTAPITTLEHLQPPVAT